MKNSEDTELKNFDRFGVMIDCSRNAVMSVPAAGITAAEGYAILYRALALGVTGMISAVLQGITASACIYAIGKNSAGSGKYVLFPAMIEFYAILALVLGIMLA